MLTEKNKFSSKNFGIRLLVGVILINSMLILLSTFSVYRNYIQYEQKAINNSQNLTEIIEQSVSNTFEKIDLVLLNTVNEVKYTDRVENLISMETFLSFQDSALLDFSSLNVINGNKEQIYSKNFSPFEPNLDKNFFIEELLKKPIDNSLHISNPVQNNNKEWFLLFARQTYQDKTQNKMIVYIIMPLNSLYKLFETMKVGKNGGIILRDKNLVTIAKNPTNFIMGGKVGEAKVSEIFKKLVDSNNNSGAFYSKDPNGNKRAVGFKKVDSYPFVISVGLSPDDYLESWKKESLELGIAVSLLIFFASFGAIFIYRSWSTLAMKDEKFELILNSAGEAIYGVNSKGVCTFCNNSAVQILGYKSKDELMGKDLKDLIFSKDQKSETQNNLKIYTSVISGESVHYDDELFKKADGSSFHVEYWSRPQHQDGKLVGAVITFVDITKKKSITDMIWKQAHYDTLTSLPNRKLFKDKLLIEMESARKKSEQMALLFIDLDHFKDVNDSLGHQVGDVLLKEASIRLLSCVSLKDTVARLGGDEFTVILPNVSSQKDIDSVTEKIINEIGKSFKIGNNNVQISASVGVTLFPLDGQNMEILLKNADQAMYVAKEKGRNCAYQFHQEMDNKLHKRLEISSDLRVAFKEEQFQLYIQPILDFKTKEVIKGEILLRWIHPIKGFISPADFIPITEEIGLISELGTWIFKKTAHVLLEWHRIGKIKKGFQLSVNVSPIQFEDEDIVNKWLDYLKEIELPTHYIVLEITEGLLLDDKSNIADKIFKFRNSGMQIAIDDFGTGYSALSYLYKYDIDYVKIDKSFVHNLLTNMKHKTITEAMIIMSHKLGFKVIAEGIEESAQENVLMQANCDFAQGFMYYKPMPINKFEELLSLGNENKTN